MSKAKSKSSILRRTRLIATGVTILLLTLALSVAALAPQNSWELGPYKLLTGPNSPPLRVRMNGAKGLGSASFVRSVGGIAFEAVAAPERSLKGKDIKLSYDKSQKDGSRLVISIGGKIYHPSLPDWMIVPISKYSDSSYTACVSLFGEKANKDFFDIVYHPAFQDTLVGMRLLQADMLLIDMDRFWDLPKFNGKVVRGLGEPLPSRKEGQSAANMIKPAFKGKAFQSWVLTDHQVPISFKVNGDTFMLTGEPYYYFWKLDLQRNSQSPKIIEVRSLTESIKAKRGALKQLNPVVYNAATKVMQYAAFFRFVKRNMPGIWSNFLKQVERMQVSPNVKTPTRWKRPA